MEDPLYGDQADARPLELRLCVEPLEGGEQLRGVGHVEPDAVVLDAEDALTVRLAGTEGDDRLGPRARELPGVPEQVLQHDPEELRVTPRLEPWCDLPGDPPRRVAVAELSRDGAGQLAQIDLHTPQVGAADP
jgi:hypothetical protein